MSADAHSVLAVVDDFSALLRFLCFRRLLACVVAPCSRLLARSVAVNALSVGVWSLGVRGCRAAQFSRLLGCLVFAVARSFVAALRRTLTL